MPRTTLNLDFTQPGTAALLALAGLETVAAAPAAVGATITVECTTDEEGIVVMSTTEETAFADVTTGILLV